MRLQRDFEVDSYYRTSNWDGCARTRVCLFVDERLPCAIAIRTYGVTGPRDTLIDRDVLIEGAMTSWPMVCDAQRVEVTQGPVSVRVTLERHKPDTMVTYVFDRDQLVDFLNNVITRWPETSLSVPVDWDAEFERVCG